MSPTTNLQPTFLSQIRRDLGLDGLSVIRVSDGHFQEHLTDGLYPQELQTSNSRCATVEATVPLPFGLLPRDAGCFVVKLSESHDFPYLALCYRVKPLTGVLDRLFNRISPAHYLSLRQSVTEYELSLLTSEFQLALRSTRELLNSFESDAARPPFGLTLQNLLEMFSLEHGSIWELHDNEYLTLEAVHNHPIAQYTTNCLPKGHGIVWRALALPEGRRLEVLTDILASDLENSHLIDDYRGRTVYLLRLGEFAHPYGVACLVGSPARPPRYNESLLDTFEQFLALELGSRRKALSNGLLAATPRLLADGQDTTAICDHIATLVLDIISCQAVSVFLKPELSARATSLTLVASRVSPLATQSEKYKRFKSGEEISYDLGKGSLTGKVCLTSLPIISNSVRTCDGNSNGYREVEGYDNNTWMAVPILTPAKDCIGVIRCTGRLTTIQDRPLNYIFDTTDQQVLTIAASTLAPLLQHKQSTKALQGLNAALEMSKKALQDVNDELETSNRIRLHEIRGSLQLILSSAEFVLDNLNDEAATSKPSRLESIVTNVGLCKTLLRTTALPTQMVFRSEIESIDLRKLLRQLSDVFRYQIEARSPSQIVTEPITGQLIGTIQSFMTVEIQGTNPKVLGHKDLLQRAFYNIGSNAIKYAKLRQKGSLVMDVREVPTAPSVIVAFRDNGIGVTPEESPRIFEGRFRGRESARRPGEGIGLKIARAIVELHGGTLSITSLAEPTVFEVVLPLIPVLK